MKSSIRSIVLIFTICVLTLLYSPVIMARTPAGGPVSTPPPEEDPTPTPGSRPSATFTFSDTSQIDANSANGRFRLVGLHLNEVIDVTVRFPAGWGNASLAIQPLDGGILSSPANMSVAADGTASLRFQAGNLPGLYRIALISARGNSTLQFWVTDPANPQANLPVLNPGH